jgi:hypothetical protein
MSHEMEIVNKGLEESRAARVAPVSSPVPCPREPIAIRQATMDDLPFIDGLQKKQTKQVGFMPTKQFEGKVKAGHVLIAEEVASGQLPVASEMQRQSTLVTGN